MEVPIGGPILEDPAASIELLPGTYDGSPYGIILRIT